MADNPFKDKKHEFSMEELEANNAIYLDRQRMYNTYGYDNEKERIFIIDSAEPVTGKILEAGTGKGYLTLELAKKGYKTVTYEIDSQIQRLAKLNITYAGLADKVEFLIENKDRLSFKDGSFDVIFCVNTLHHFADSATALDELLRVLAQTGRLIISDFTQKTFEIMDRVHASEGGKHEVIGWSMDKAAEYLKDKGCSLRETSDAYQRVFTVKKGK
jgi:ubiquinone/menaquinone biosynthesis C-methylase UbiE